MLHNDPSRIATMNVPAEPAPSLEHGPVSWADRLVAAAYYCGIAPLLAWTRRGRPYREHHYAQALAVWFGLLAIGLLYAVVSLFLSYVLVYRRDWYEDTWLEPTLLATVRRGFLCWLVFWAFSVFWALRGSWGAVPLLGRLVRRPWAMTASGIGCVLFIATVALTAAATAHAKSLTREGGTPAKAYMLYDDMGFVPHWIFDLGFYPIALQSTAKWGRDSVVVEPLTRKGLAKAFASGTFVFVLSHGTEEGLYTSKLRIRPANAAPRGANEDLQFVYITGCDSGALAREWERTLAPAKVVTFDRLSAWLEHIWWLLFRGAGVVRSMS